MIQYANRAVPRADLGAAAQEFVMNEADFVASEVLPDSSVQQKAAYIAVITREGITREVDAKRQAGGGYNRDSFNAEDMEYACVEYGLEGPVEDSRRREYASDFDAELVTVQSITRKLLVQREKRVAAAVFNATTWDSGDATLYTDLSSTAPWTTAGSAIRSYINTAKEVVRVNCGLEPNALVINKVNMDRLVATDELRDAIKYTARPSDAEVRSAIADYLGLERVIVAKATTNSAKEGQTFVGAAIWSNLYAMLAVISSGGAMPTPGIGCSPLWAPDSPTPIVVESYREEQTRNEIFRVRHTIDELIVDKYFGHLLKVAAS